MRCLPLLLSIALATPLLAQSESGMLEVARGSDGTRVLIDSARVVRSGDSTFVVPSEYRFGAPVGTERQANRELDLDEVDCAGQRSRSLASALLRDSVLVHGDLGAASWQTWPEEGAPLSRLICARLLETFAALRIELEVGGVTDAPELTNPVAVGRALEEHYPETLRGSDAARGEAAVRVRVESNGIPAAQGAWVVFAPHPDFAQAALQVVAGMRFRPAKLRGTAVPVWVTLPIRFDGR